MKLATYNVNGINGRLDVLLRWLEEASPDIVCLQELKAPQDKFPIEAIEKAGYKAVWHGQKQWNGVAILSKDLEIKEIGRLLPGDAEDGQSRYLEALVGEMVVACIYLPNGNPAPGPKLDYKLRWLERLSRRAEKLLEHKIPVIIAGDFNVMPTELDVYKPEKYEDDALFRTEVRQAFHELLGQGWTDALRYLYPYEKMYTFWDYFRNAYARNAGLRIDHFLLSPELLPKLKSGGVDMEVRGWDKTSDHAPVWIEFSAPSK
ncbi:exodeoxyribonuclease III [Flavobacterium qiangtangense]|uniref:Exodeoxyribonuclease III n=1 Tax=Flavobacterium qiangtangense TaxID=1442595 RepID=A0ABW1PK88_9FLAO